MKLREFQSVLQRKRIDAALFLNTSDRKQDPALEYFAQLPVDAGALVVPADKEPFLLISGFEYARIRRAAPVKVVEAKGSLIEALKGSLKGAKRIGVNEQFFSLLEAKRLKQVSNAAVVPLADAVNALRLTKTEKEVALIRKACLIGCEIMNECIDEFSRFRTEEDVDRFLRTRTLEVGCELSFPPIVASGGHAAVPHHVPNGRLAKGFVVLDFGVRKDGYCSDMTRTIYIGGSPTPREREAYEILLKAQEWGVRQVRHGIDEQKLERDVARKLGAYKRRFIHRLGHSVGLQVHDAMSSSMNDNPVLRENMVWTVEPGIYVPDRFGMRIEDTVLVTRRGCEVLTKNTPKHLTIIPS